MKKIFQLLLFCFINVVSFAQNNPFFNSDDLKTLKSVVSGALYVLRQDYYIIDTTVKPNIKSGINGNNYFGRYYFIAILADGKFYTDKNINSPWELDEQFNSYTELKKYIPVLSGLAYRKNDSKEFRQIDSITKYNKLRILISDSNRSFASLNAPDSLPSLHLAVNNVRLYDSSSYHLAISVNESKEYSQFKLIDTIPIIDFDLSKGKYSLNKNGYINNGFFYNEKTIGGFIFTTNASLGKVEYFLSGVISRNKSGKFDMIPIKSKVQKVSEIIKETTLPIQIQSKEAIVVPAKITEIKDN